MNTFSRNGTQSWKKKELIQTNINKSYFSNYPLFFIKLILYSSDSKCDPVALSGWIKGNSQDILNHFAGVIAYSYHFVGEIKEMTRIF